MIVVRILDGMDGRIDFFLFPGSVLGVLGVFSFNGPAIFRQLTCLQL